MRAARRRGAAPAAKPAPLEPVLGLIATADVAKGEKLAAKCATCHTFTADGKNKVGPGLYGVVGRVSGTHEGFAYSEPMKAHAKPWTFADISHFIARPKDFIPGTKMTFPGLPKVQDRADLLAWLGKQSASPAPLPTPDEIAAEEAALKIGGRARRRSCAPRGRRRCRLKARPLRPKAPRRPRTARRRRRHCSAQNGGRRRAAAGAKRRHPDRRRRSGRRREGRRQVQGLPRHDQCGQEQGRPGIVGRHRPQPCLGRRLRLFRRHEGHGRQAVDLRGTG